MANPTSHVAEGLKLTADAEVDLFTLFLPQESIYFRFKNNDTVTWQGNTYEGLACQLSGEEYSADGSEAKPTLRVINPEGIFNAPVMEGRLFRAILTKRTVLRRHLDADTNIFRQRMWYVERPKELVSGQLVSLELRSMIEGPNFQIPMRSFIPPEFPTVSI